MVTAMPPIRAAIFDLDGTLVDSLGDIAGALTTALAAHGLPAPALDAVRGWVGDGARALVGRAVGDRVDPEAVHGTFREAYRAAPMARTRLYDGLAAALDELAGRGLTFAIVSNKPHDLTQHLAAALLTAWPFAVVFGQRANLPLKPDPTVALIAADELGLAPARCAFIGDSGIDVATARAAQMRAIAVSWGFRPRSELVAAGPDALVDVPGELCAAIVG